MSSKTKGHSVAEIAARRVSKMNHKMRQRPEPLLAIKLKDGKAYATPSDLSLIRQGKAPKGVGGRVFRGNGDHSRSKYNPIIEDTKKGYRQ